MTACAEISGYVTASGDCDDTDGAVHPDAVEVCNGLDDDCEGTVDEGAADAATFYADSDGDGFGDEAATVAACSAPPGYVADHGDCDDGASAVNPDAEETCDGTDEDCDSVVDGPPVVFSVYYADNDADGFGDGGNSVSACAQPSGYVPGIGDCDDTSSDVSPDAAEICANGIDEDCDGIDSACIGGDYPASDADLAYWAPSGAVSLVDGAASGS